MTRKHFTKAIKAEVAIEAIKGQKTVGELSSEYGVYSEPLQLTRIVGKVIVEVEIS